MWTPADAYALSGPRKILYRSALLFLVLEFVVGWATAPLIYGVTLYFETRDETSALATKALLVAGSLINVLSVPVLLIGIVVLIQARKAGPLTRFQRGALLALACVCVYSIVFRWLSNGPGSHPSASILISLMHLVILTECVLRLRDTPSR